MINKFICFICILLLAACHQQEKSFNGYVDADLIYLSADFGGRLVALPVQRCQLVNTKQFCTQFRSHNLGRLNELLNSMLTSDNALPDPIYEIVLGCLPAYIVS